MFAFTPRTRCNLSPSHCPDRLSPSLSLRNTAEWIAMFCLTSHNLHPLWAWSRRWAEENTEHVS